MALEKHIEGVFATKKGPGVLVKGANRECEEDVFDALSRLLNEFYYRKGLVMPTVPFEKNRESYRLPVYPKEAPAVQHRYFDKATGQQLGFDLELEELAELIRKGHDIGREELLGIEPGKYGHITIRKLDPEVRAQYVRDWDFPHEPLRINKPVFLVYFNAYDRNKAEAERMSMQDRDDFIAMAGAA